MTNYSFRQTGLQIGTLADPLIAARFSNRSLPLYDGDFLESITLLGQLVAAAGAVTQSINLSVIAHNSAIPDLLNSATSPPMKSVQIFDSLAIPPIDYPPDVPLTANFQAIWKVTIPAYFTADPSTQHLMVVIDTADVTNDSFFTLFAHIRSPQR